MHRWVKDCSLRPRSRVRPPHRRGDAYGDNGSDKFDIFSSSSGYTPRGRGGRVPGIDREEGEDGAQAADGDVFFLADGQEGRDWVALVVCDEGGRELAVQAPFEERFRDLVSLHGIKTALWQEAHIPTLLERSPLPGPRIAVLGHSF